MAGDCLMLGFGVPLEQPDSAQRAVKRRARDADQLHGARRSSWRERYQIEAGLGIGINEGDVVAGNIGSSSYMNYTIIGDTVNIAARLCQRARAGEMLFSSTLKQLPRHARASTSARTPLPPLAAARPLRTRSTSTACRWPPACSCTPPKRPSPSRAPRGAIRSLRAPRLGKLPGFRALAVRV